MKINLIATKEILELEKEINRELIVTERPFRSGLSKYYVTFDGGESMEGGCLVTHSGNGSTIDMALLDYCTQISCRRMVFGAYTDKRIELEFPKLIHTLLLNK